MNALFVSDLDGTFLEPDSEVPDNAPALVERLKKNGYSVIFASARPFGNIKNQLGSSVSPDWIISNDGALAYYNTGSFYSLIIENSLEENLVRSNVSLLNSFGVCPLLFLGSKHKYKVMIPHDTEDWVARDVMRSDPSRRYDTYKDIERALEEGNVRSVSLYGNLDETIVDAIKKHNASKANVMYYKETRFRGAMWLDVISICADKYSVAKRIAEHSGLHDIAIALGNGRNDLNLIKGSKWSAIPVNADPLLIAHADYVSKHSEGGYFIADIETQLENKLWLA